MASSASKMSLFRTEGAIYPSCCVNLHLRAKFEHKVFKTYATYVANEKKFREAKNCCRSTIFRSEATKSESQRYNRFLAHLCAKKTLHLSLRLAFLGPKVSAVGRL